MAFAFLLLALLVVIPGEGASPALAQQQQRPNIVFIMTDDQDAASVARMPNVQRLIAQQGTTFGNSFASTPQCCPSRASFLTGKYTHNHKVFTNLPPDGGYEEASEIGLEKSTIATWLDRSGYATAYMGKYLNQYFGPEVPPGWDKWYGYTRGMSNANGYFVNENGTERWVPRAEQADPDYLAAKAETFIKGRRADGPPFFMVMAPFTPHNPYFHAPRHAAFYPNLKVPRTPDFNEADFSDKPAKLARKPSLTEEQVAGLDEKYRDRMRGLRGVDEMVDRTVRALGRGGHLRDTYIVYVSDNGYLVGGHRWEGKDLPYEGAIRVPFMVRGPGVPAGARKTQMVANVDWAPTIADWAGVEPAHTVDGRSVDPLFSGDPEWRKRLLIEYYTTDPDGYRSDFKGLRTADGKSYTEYPSGEREFYDLSKDPYQLENASSTMDPALQADLAAKLAVLKECAGQACRDAEAAP